MKDKAVLKPRGVRFSDEQWARLGKRAEAENKKNKNATVTASDVVRYAVEQVEQREADKQAQKT